jgi:hypothetical protein
MNKQSFRKIATWLRRKMLAAKTKQDEAQACLSSTGISEVLAYSQWMMQVSAQCKPLPGKNNSNTLEGHFLI